MPIDKGILVTWIRDALQTHGGKADIPSVAKHIWQHHEDELRAAGDLFYTWQYDMRWAAQEMRDQGICRPASETARGAWELALAN